MEKITVVTITYNLIKSGREISFRECMASVFCQTYGNVEHLIIDGASDDGTLELIREYEGFCKCYSEPDEGIYDAMNKGIQRATGDYIIFLNSDDYFTDMEALEKLLENIKKNNSDFSCATVTTDKNGIISEFKPGLNSFYKTMPFSHQSMLTKTQTLRDIGGFDTRFKMGADLDLIIRLILAGYKASVCDANVAYFRCGGVSAIHYKQVQDEYAQSFKLRYAPFYNLTEGEALKLAKLKGDNDKLYTELEKYLKVHNSDFYEKFMKGSRKNFPPLLTVKKDFKNINCNLLGVIPFFRLKKRWIYTNFYLFNIPVLKIKKRLRA